MTIIWKNQIELVILIYKELSITIVLSDKTINYIIYLRILRINGLIFIKDFVRYFSHNLIWDKALKHFKGASTMCRSDIFPTYQSVSCLCFKMHIINNRKVDILFLLHTNFILIYSHGNFHIGLTFVWGKWKINIVE